MAKLNSKVLDFNRQIQAAKAANNKVDLEFLARNTDNIGRVEFESGGRLVAVSLEGGIEVEEIY